MPMPMYYAPGGRRTLATPAQLQQAVAQPPQAQGAAGPQNLQAQRDLAFGSLDQGAGIFRGDLGRATSDQLLAGVRGERQPFTDEARKGLLASETDSALSGRGAEEQQIRRFFAARGMEGGGGELAALVGSGRRFAARMQQARNKIDVMAILENYQAQERALEGATGFMSQQAAAEAPFRLKAADLRSRFEVTGQSPFGGGGAAGAAPSLTTYSGQPAALAPRSAPTNRSPMQQLGWFDVPADEE